MAGRVGKPEAKRTIVDCFSVISVNWEGMTKARVTSMPLKNYFRMLNQFSREESLGEDQTIPLSHR